MTSVPEAAAPGAVPPRPDSGRADAGRPGPPDHGYVPYEPDRMTRIVSRITARSPLWLAPAAVLACMAATAGYTLISEPARADADAIPTCLVKYTTGFDCPGCGGTRALWYLLHANLPAAARHHAVAVFAAPFLLWLYVAWAGQKVFGWRLPTFRLSPLMLGLFLGGWGVFSVLRNLPWAPFTWFFV
jgi:hypothetical protein